MFELFGRIPRSSAVLQKDHHRFFVLPARCISKQPALHTGTQARTQKQALPVEQGVKVFPFHPIVRRTLDHLDLFSEEKGLCKPL